ncbi:MAG TPA: AMP-binding protein, partial [Steroidobacteraceae bacterium]|nr:AMP-binding protein [Steroidobacteraceae bacterium]
MTDARTLIDLLDFNRQRNNTLTYLEGEHVTKSVSFAELAQRAGSILHELQERGARRGDKLILFVASNEHFIDAFWAAALGAIIPVPVALGISDEHRHKLLRIAHKLGTPFIYTDRKTLERVGQFAAQSQDPAGAATFAQLRPRAFLVEDLVDLGRAGTAHAARPQDTAFIQFSSGSTSDP